MKKLISTAASVLALSILLTGCGGGGSSQDNQSNTNVDGFWIGVFTENDIASYGNLILHKGQIISESYTSPDKQYSIGTYTVNDNLLSATLTSKTGIRTTISATIEEQSILTGTYSSTDGSNGTISFAYGSLAGISYDTPSNQEYLSGTWWLDHSNYGSYADAERTPYYNDDFYTTIAISSDGTITGSNGKGCIFNGSMTTPDPTHPIYIVDIDISNCGTDNGKLQGLGITDQRQTGIIDELYLYVTNNSELSYWDFDEVSD